MRVNGAGAARGGLDGGGDTLDGVVEVVDRPPGIAGGVLDGAAGEAGFDRQADGLGDAGGSVAETVLQVGGDGKRGRVHDGAGIGEGVVAAGLPVGAAEGEGEAGACGGQGLEAQLFQEFGAAGVPGVRDDEAAGARVQFPEQRGLAVIGGFRWHGGTHARFRSCFGEE